MQKTLIFMLVFFLVLQLYSVSGLNLTDYTFSYPLLIDSNSDGTHLDEPVSIIINATCYYSDNRDFRITYKNDTFVNYRRFDNNQRVVFKVNSTNSLSNEYWAYCYNEQAGDVSNSSFFRVYDDFKENPWSSKRWDVAHNSTAGYGLTYEPNNNRILMTTDPDSGIDTPVFARYNESGGFYSSSVSELYYSIIAGVTYEQAIEGTLPHRYVGIGETNIAYPSKTGGVPNPIYGGSIFIDSLPERLNNQCNLRLNYSSVYTCANEVLAGGESSASVPTIKFRLNSTHHLEYFHNGSSLFNSTQYVNNTNYTAFFMTDYANSDLRVYKVAMDTEDFNLYEPESRIELSSSRRYSYHAPNITTPVIPPGYYTENHTITAYSRIYDTDDDSLRANISVNASTSTVMTQYISSVTSFEKNNSNGWTLNQDGIAFSSIESEGNHMYKLAHYDDYYLSNFPLSKNINLSNYDFMIFDYQVRDYKFWIKINSTTIFTSENENEVGVFTEYNHYINLSAYGGPGTITFETDVISGCLLDPWSCSNSKAYIDNIRFGAYFDNNEYNITSNTNVTTVFNLQSGTNVSSQDLLDVDNNFTVVFNISDSTGNTTTRISNLMNISNRIPSITNITLTPISAFMNATLLSYAFTDPDDGQLNTSQYCRWYKNGTLVYGGGDCVLNIGNYSDNDILVAEVKATDGYNYSAYVNSTNLTVGDRSAPAVLNISVPSTGYVGNQQSILVDCDDDLSPIESVTINITDSDNQLVTYTMTYYTGNTYRLYYTPGKAGTHYFTGISCTDSSYNQNVTLFNYSMSVSERATSEGPAGGGDGGDDTEIITEVIVQKPENESLFLFKTMAGTGATDIVLLPNQVRKITLKLISQHDKELSIKLYCADETVANLCRNTEFSNQTIKLKPSAVENVDVQIKAPDEFNYGDTGKFNMVARLVVLDSVGKTVDSKEQKVVRIQETISSWAYPALWAYNQFTFYIPYRGVWIPKAIVFTLAAGLMTLLFSLIIRSGLALTGLFFVFYFAASVLEMLLSM